MRLRFMGERGVRAAISARHGVLWFRTGCFRAFYGMDLHPSVRISFKSRLDKTNPRRLTIGEKTLVAFDAIILTHDYSTARHGDRFEERTTIGSRCFIGAGAIILPGVTIGDHCIIGAGSVVISDVPAGSIVVGNPGKVVRSGITTTDYGRLKHPRPDGPTTHQPTTTEPTA